MIDHLNIQHLKYLSILFSAIEFMVLLRYSLRAYPSRATIVWLSFIPLAFYLMSLNQWENYLMALNAMFFLAILMATLMIISIREDPNYWKVASVVAFGLMGTFASAGGLVAWPIGLLVAYKAGWKRRLWGLGLMAVGVVAVYLRGLNQGNGLRFALSHMHLVAKFFLVVLGNSVFGFFANKPILSLDMITGVLILFVVGWVVWDFIRRGSPLRELSWIGLVGLGLGEGMLITLGRAPMGLQMGAASRYSTLTMPAISGAYLYAVLSYGRKSSLVGGFLLSLITVGTLVGLVEEARMGRYRYEYFFHLKQVLINVKAPSNKQLSPFLWSPHVIRSGIVILKRFHLNVFHK